MKMDPYSTKPESNADKIFTVSELNRQIRELLETGFSSLWIEGEISNFKHHSSGHMYFSLKDERSQMGAVFFSRYHARLKFQLKDGLKVLIRGRVSVYEPRGQYQIYVEEVLPKGIGDLQLAFNQMRERLEREGLFDPAHKKPIPKFPKRVGVVTSPTGAAIQDILNVVKRRFYGTHLILVPVLVQGEGAAKQIARAIEMLNDFGQVDVMIVGRGGGSLEDLWAFNEEVVARAVFASRIPVISAVGHEIDWTICDLVSDLRAPTPSAAAELVVQNREEIERTIEDAIERLKRNLQNRIAFSREDWTRLISSYAFRQPRSLVQNAAQRLDELLRPFQSDAQNLLRQKFSELETQMAKLEALSPLAILRRGYSLTSTSDGRLIKEKSQIKIGARIRTRITHAIIDSEIRSIEEC